MDVDISLTPQAKAGDWVIVHVVFVMEFLDTEKAAETLAAMQAVADAQKSVAVGAM